MFVYGFLCPKDGEALHELLTWLILKCLLDWKHRIHLTVPPTHLASTAIKMGMYCHLLLNSIITPAQACLFSLQKKWPLSQVNPILSSSSLPDRQEAQAQGCREAGAPDIWTVFLYPLSGSWAQGQGLLEIIRLFKRNSRVPYPNPAHLFTAIPDAASPLWTADAVHN